MTLSCIAMSSLVFLPDAERFLADSAVSAKLEVLIDVWFNSSTAKEIIDRFILAPRIRWSAIAEDAAHRNSVECRYWDTHIWHSAQRYRHVSMSIQFSHEIVWFDNVHRKLRCDICRYMELNIRLMAPEFGTYELHEENRSLLHGADSVSCKLEFQCRCSES